MAIFVVVSLGFTATAPACVCAEGRSLERAIASAPYVFRAQVVAAETDFYDSGYKTTIHVARIFPHKGGNPPFSELTTFWSCDARAAVPAEYWFFADEKGAISRCGDAYKVDSPFVEALEQSYRSAVVSGQVDRDFDPGGAGVPDAFDVRIFAAVALGSNLALWLISCLRCFRQARIHSPAD